MFIYVYVLKRVYFLGVLLAWREYKQVFIGFASINVRFEVSIQRLFFTLYINHYISINHHFKVLAQTINSSKEETSEIEF